MQNFQLHYAEFTDLLTVIVPKLGVLGGVKIGYY